MVEELAACSPNAATGGQQRAIKDSRQAQRETDSSLGGDGWLNVMNLLPSIHHGSVASIQAPVESTVALRCVHRWVST